MLLLDIKKYNLTYIHQKEQLGTGNAVLITENEFNNFKGDILSVLGKESYSIRLLEVKEKFNGEFVVSYYSTSI